MTLNLFVIGATGNTGSRIVELALERGHRVTAFVRTPQKMRVQHPALSVVRGDPLQGEQVARALPGHHAVLSALGPSAREAFRPSTLLARGAASTIAAMNATGMRRLSIVSAALLFSDRRLTFRFFQWLLRQHIRDLTAMEALVHASALDFTIARPPRLVEAPASAYRSERDAFPSDAPAVMSFAGVARFMLDSVQRPELFRATVGLASGA